LDAAIRRLPAGDVKRLEGRSAQWRLRVSGWRVVFILLPAERTVIIQLVSPRGGAYEP